MVARFQEEVQGELERHVGVQQAAVLRRLAGASAFPAGFKRSLAVQALTDPWAGLIALERHGHRIAELAAAGSGSLPSLIAAMEAGMDRPADSFTPIPFPAGRTREEHVAFLLAVLEQAHHLREKALRRLGPEERRFLFEYAASFVEHFSPQVEGLDELTMPQAQADERFCRLANERLDYAALAAAAQVLARLADEGWLQNLAEAFRVLKPGGRFAVSDVVIRGSLPSALRGNIELWIGCVAGALEEQEYRRKLTSAGFIDISVEPTRVYRAEDARAFLAESGVDDPDAVAQDVDGKFMSAFVRARKPACQ